MNLPSNIREALGLDQNSYGKLDIEYFQLRISKMKNNNKMLLIN